MSSTASSVNASNNNVGRSLAGGAGVPLQRLPAPATVRWTLDFRRYSWGIVA
ncbi:MAG: hypothetical protein R3A10_01725 [Caldilineaceae bacterium]